MKSIHSHLSEVEFLEHGNAYFVIQTNLDFKLSNAKFMDTCRGKSPKTLYIYRVVTTSNNNNRFSSTSSYHSTSSCVLLLCQVPFLCNRALKMT